MWCTKWRTKATQHVIIIKRFGTHASFPKAMFKEIFLPCTVTLVCKLFIKCLDLRRGGCRSGNLRQLLDYWHCCDNLKQCIIVSIQTSLYVCDQTSHNISTATLKTEIYVCKILFWQFFIFLGNVNSWTFSSLTMIWLVHTRIKSPLHEHDSGTNLAIHVLGSME